ncbi:MAG: type IV pilus assembly protein PilM [Acidimicrobiales bacterium]
MKQPKVNLSVGRRGKKSHIGLDIGSTAVRAAEVTVDGRHRTMERFAQVALPPGAVVDGEVVDPPVVAASLRQLWEEGGFSSRNVVVGVSSQRVIVRPADVAAMPADEFRLALQFEAQELIPIPVEEAVLDFTIVDPGLESDSASGASKMRILLAAAHRDMVRAHLAALDLAGLHADAVDVVPLALVRAAPPSPSPDGGADAVVCFGGDLTTVAVRDGGVTRFTRTVNLGGSRLTNSVAAELSVDAGRAEALKRGSDATAPVAVRATTTAVIASQLPPLVDEVQSSIDYFLAQSDRDQVDRILLTGGAVTTEGLVAALGGAVRGQIALAQPFAGIEVASMGLTSAELERAQADSYTPIGIALWGAELPESRLSLLPPEIVRSRRQRRLAQMAGAGLASLALVLGAAWAVRDAHVRHVHAEVTAIARQNDSLQVQLRSLAKVTSLKAAIASGRSTAQRALAGDVAVTKVLAEISAALPANEALTSFAWTPAATVPAPATAASANLGTLQLGVTAKGGQDSVAQWLRAMATVPALSDVWVGGSASSGGNDTFTSSATLTQGAASSRAANLPGANQP